MSKYVTVNGTKAVKTGTKKGLVYYDIGKEEPFMFLEGTPDYSGHVRIKSQTKGFVSPVTGTRYRQKDQSAPVCRVKMEINWSKIA